jgi:uncharacterized membrane protein
MRPMDRRSRVWLLRALVLLGSFSFCRLALAQHLGGSVAVPPDTGVHGSTLALLAVGLVGLALVALATSGTSTGGQRPGPQARAWMNVDVSVVRIGIDLRSREFMQRELGKIRIDGSPRSRSLLESLGATVRLLRKCDAAWVYGGSSNYHPMSPPVAEGVFARHVTEARAAHTDAAADPEAQRVALITLVVAARREIRDFFGGHRGEINAVLDDLERLTPAELVALDVVWTPGDADEVMTAAALEALLPDLAKLAPMPSKKKGRPVGRLHCAYCRGPFAAELPTCPHCGAPAPADPVPE